MLTARNPYQRRPCQVAPFVPISRVSHRFKAIAQPFLHETLWLRVYLAKTGVVQPVLGTEDNAICRLREPFARNDFENTRYIRNILVEETSSEPGDFSPTGSTMRKKRPHEFKPLYEQEYSDEFWNLSYFCFQVRERLKPGQLRTLRYAGDTSIEYDWLTC